MAVAAVHAATWAVVAVPRRLLARCHSNRATHDCPSSWAGRRDLAACSVLAAGRRNSDDAGALVAADMDSYVVRSVAQHKLPYSGGYYALLVAGSSNPEAAGAAVAGVRNCC